MWFKQTDPKSPQQPRTGHDTPAQPAPPAVPPLAPSASAPAPAEPARGSVAPAAAPAISPQGSRITPGISLKGEISGSEDLWLGGSIEGALRFNGARVTIGGTGSVRGEVEAREIVVEGRLDGNLRAVERVAVSRSGQVKGGASAPRVAVEDGAVFNGTIEVIREGEARAASRIPPAKESAAPVPAHRAARAAAVPAGGSAARIAGASTPAGIASGAPVSGAENPGGHSTEETQLAPRSVPAAPPAPDSE